MKMKFFTFFLSLLVCIHSESKSKIKKISQNTTDTLKNLKNRTDSVKKIDFYDILKGYNSYESAKESLDPNTNSSDSTLFDSSY